MTIPFTYDDSSMKFEFMYEGFVLGGSLENNKGMTVLRTEIKILDKFEAISDLYPCEKKLPTGEPNRFLSHKENLELELTNEELKLIMKYMSLVPWQTGSPARNFIKTYDWLSSFCNHDNKTIQ